jgi:hypothetical protein
MNQYDPQVAPDPQAWLALDENERTKLVERYHRRQRIRMPNVRAHAMFHVIVENQIAMGDETPAAAKLQELIREGMDRHDAVHAIGSVVSKWFYYTARGELTEDPKEWYYRELKAWTKKRWEEEFGEEA